MKSGASGKEITVRLIGIPTDPPTQVFSVEIGDNKSSWKETIPTEENLHWFIRGLQAGGAMFGDKHVSLPEIPQNSVPLNSENS